MINKRRFNKIFCIGLNKTGTTSLEKTFNELGFIVGNQADAEKIFFKDFFDRRFDALEQYCKTAEVFQDVPFAFFDFIPFLDTRFPNSKFILTIRDCPQQWYNSVINFHSKLYSNENKLPTKTELLEAKFLGKGFVYKMIKEIFRTPDEDLYNEFILINYYLNHIKRVELYFKGRESDLLKLNLSNKNQFNQFLNFIEIDSSTLKEFPWENKTIDI